MELAPAALEAVPNPAAEDAGPSGAAVAVAADGGLALGLADADRFDLLAEVTKPGRGCITELADRAGIGDGVRRAQLPAVDALVFRPGSTCLTEAGAVLLPMDGSPVSPASGALFEDQRIAGVAAAADRSLLATGDDVAALAAAGAGPAFRSSDAPVTAAALRGIPVEAAAGSVAACAGQLGDGVAVPGGFKVLKEPDDLERTVG
ncbi:hypothetical protein [Streptomyces sp. NBC_00893]|uniref:hypothetical protein n=1 Tax=Streptomyces sp. NBC_00893 TaxID=2975862 RepID=UPI0022543912|nr:hypothetical protein [Streptomyces sp. NBC_00893]MCX4852133.1 hypothetical protein [Streptomyces sp. NBC_00893]